MTIIIIIVAETIIVEVKITIGATAAKIVRQRIHEFTGRVVPLAGSNASIS